MKTTTILAASAVFAILMTPQNVFALEDFWSSTETEPAAAEPATIKEIVKTAAAAVEAKAPTLDDGIKVLENLPKPIRNVSVETQRAGSYLKIVAESFAESEKNLNTLEKEHKAAYSKAKTNEEKRKINADYIKRKMKIIDTTLGDLEFAQVEFNKVKEKVNTLLGNIDVNQSIAEQMAQEIVKTDKCEAEVEQIVREYKRLNEDKPKRGTPEYNEWLNKQQSLISRYDIALEEFDNAVYLGGLLENIASQAHASADQVEDWIIYLHASETEYTKAINTLKGTKKAHEITLAAIDAHDAFYDMQELGNIAKLSQSLIGGLKSIPKIDEIGSIPTAPKVERPSLDVTIDFNKRREEIRSGLNIPKTR